MKKYLFLVAALTAASTTFGSILANEKYVTNTVNEVVYTASTQIIEKVVTDHSITNEAAVAVAKEYTDAKTAAAITTASEDATTKATAAKEGAEAAAKTYTDTATNAVASAGASDLEAAKTELNTNIATAKAAAVAEAAVDASTKTNAVLEQANAFATSQATAAKDAAQSYADTQDAALKSTIEGEISAASNNVVAVAAADATAKADAAKAGADAYTDGATNAVYVAAKADLAAAKIELDGNAQNYANTAESNAKADATLKDNAIKQAAAEDATEKATYARTNAIDVAKSYTDEKSTAAESNAKTYADGLKTTLDTTIAANKTDIEGELASATNTLTTSIDGVAARMTTAEGRLDGHDTQIATLEGKIAGVYHFKGTVSATNDLPATAENADVYYVRQAKESYAYLIPTGTETGTWTPIGKDFDLSSYRTWLETKSYIDNADSTLQGNIDTVGGNLTALEGTVAANKTDIEAKNNVVSNKVAALEVKEASDKSELETSIAAADTKAQTGIDNAAAALARANAVEADLTVVINSNKVDLTKAIATAKSEAIAQAGVLDTALKNELSPLITAAQTQADKGVADAATADSKAVDAKNFAVAASNNVMIAAKGYADDAEAAAKSDAATNLASAKTELENAIALKDSITSVNAKIASVSNNLETIAQTKASAAETAAKDDATTKVANLKSYVDTQDAAVSNNVYAMAKAYTDSKDPGSKSYVEEQIKAVSNNVVKIAAADATFKVNDAKVYLIDQDGQVMRYAREQDTVVSNAAIAAVASAKTELTTSINAVDARVTGVQTYAEGASNNVLTAAKEFTTMTKSALEESIQTAKNEAIATAAADASTKTNAVLAQAKTYSDAQLSAKVGAITQTTVMGEITAQANAAMTYSDNRLSNAKTELLANDTVVSNAAIAAVSTAKSELNTSIGNVSASVTTLRNDMNIMSNNVLTAAYKRSSDNLATAKSYAEAQAAAVKTDLTSPSGAIAVATNATLAAAKADATSKANAAQSAAETTAHGELTTAVSTLNTTITQAKADAIQTSEDFTTNKVAELKTYVNAQDTVVSNAFVAADTKLNTALTKSINDNVTALNTTITTKETALKTQITTGDDTTYVNASNCTERLIKYHVLDKWTPTSKDPGEEEEDVYNLAVEPHSVSTILPSKSMNEDAEIYVTCSGSNDRNFTLFIPNEPELIAGMPITVETEFPATMRAAFATRRQLYKLPAKILCEQPYEKLTVLTVTELDDGSEWTPTVTNVCIVCTNTATTGVSPKFVCNKAKASLEGTSLHVGTQFKIAYPTSTGVTTNDFIAVDSKGKVPTTFYYYTGSAELTPTDMQFTTEGDKLTSWFDIIYSTVNGSATIPRQTVSFDVAE